MQMPAFLSKLQNKIAPGGQNSAQYGGQNGTSNGLSNGALQSLQQPKRDREINLVPDIKDEFIKTLKFRNFVFFLCIIIASGSLVVILVFLSIAGGQQGFVDAKQTTLDALQQKITAYSDLSDFLTIRDQLGNIASITENKVMMSRTFNILSAIIPSSPDADNISISELSINLAGDAPIFTIDAQANAVTEPFIDYNVLDAFKKSMQYMRYDYGEYVDKEDNSIPAYCIVESDTDGATLKDQSRGYYAYWLIEGTGCYSAVDEFVADLEAELEYEDTPSSTSNSSSTSNNSNTSGNTSSDAQSNTSDTIDLDNLDTSAIAVSLATEAGYQTEIYDGQNVVKIWRTPQFTDWYKSDPDEDEPYMDLEGSIHNIPHFNSSCITYSGTENDNGTITWSSTNDSCKLVPTTSDDEEGGIIIEESSNGRNTDDELVLRFSATITFAPEVFNFNNHHMLALSPASRRNVTDSYSQIQSIFAERAADCEQDDTACFTTPTSASESTNNSTNSNNSNSSSSSSNSNNTNNNT